MLRVGLTGGIGSGKSTVASRLATLGAVVIDADRIAREVVEPGTPGLDAVITEFGSRFLRDGSLDRRALGREVFADEDQREKLNAIVHPRVFERRNALVAAASTDAIVMEDIPLLVENGLGSGFHLVVVVHAPAQERVRRLVAERGMAAEDVWARVRAQADDDARRAGADVWLDNSGAREELVRAVDGVWHDRLVPFEANLRAGRHAPRAEQAVIAEPDPRWPMLAQRLIGRLQFVIGDRATRIEHIGSTAVVGLPAKDVIDVQVVVDDLAAAAQVADQLSEAGLVRMAGEWDDIGRDGASLAKAVACNADPGRAVNVHIRPVDSPAWRDALLLRDWLRAHPDGVTEYAALKRRLAAEPHDSIEAYASTKTPWVNDALERADAWAARAG